MASTKKVTDCPAGGFVAVQQKLLGEEEIKCDSCKLILAKFKFNSADLKETVESVVKGLTAVQPLKDLDRDESAEPGDAEPCAIPAGQNEEASIL